MNDTNNERRGSPVAMATAALLFLLVLYILSPGPVIWLCGRAGYLDAPWIEIAFAPLGWLYDTFPIVHQLYDWYFELFGFR
jgi:hypothetical protein